MIRLGEVIQAIESSWRIESLRVEVRGAKKSWKYWQTQDRRRLETYPEGDVQIKSGDVSWRSSTEEGIVEYHNTSMSYEPPEGLADLTGLLSANLTVVAEEQVAGRRAARLMARPRPGAIDPLHRWALQKPQTEIWVDIERGVGLQTSNLNFRAVIDRLADRPAGGPQSLTVRRTTQIFGQDRIIDASRDDNPANAQGNHGQRALLTHRLRSRSPLTKPGH